MKFTLLIAVFILISTFSFAQIAAIPTTEWVKKLSDRADKKNHTSRLLWDSLVNSTDSSGMNRLLRQLEGSASSGNTHFRIRVNLYKALVLARIDILRKTQASKATVMKLMKQVMQDANETNDEYLVAFTSKVYSFLARSYNETDLALMYAMYSVELNEKLFGTDELDAYYHLAERMYHLREYDKCRYYCLKWLSILRPRDGKDNDITLINNTIALTYHRTGNYDSAMFYYNKALTNAVKLAQRDWIGIVSGNMGQVYYELKKFDTAIALLESEYRISMQFEYLFHNAANALQWAATANVAVGKNARALHQIREAITLNKLYTNEIYQRNIYAAAVKVYNANDMVDSALYFSGLYQPLHDSIEKKINASSVAIPNVRLMEEKNRYNIRMLQENKKSQLLKRNIIILGIVLLFFISILMINKQRIKFRLRQEVLEREKELIQTKLASDKQQKEMSAQHSIEKSSLIENLEQLKEKDASAVRQENITILSNLTILTDQDWDKFKELFEKTYPMFFQKLKAKAPGITVAEQRMAALIRLQLNTRQMASMQGISPDSVHKTRQRLRHRLAVSNEINLEEFFVSFQNNSHMS